MKRWFLLLHLWQRFLQHLWRRRLRHLAFSSPMLVSFLTFLASSLRSLLSFFLTLLLLLCLLVLWQSERLFALARWLEAEPQARARAFATLLEKSDLVEQASIASVEKENAIDKNASEGARDGIWVVSNASLRLASGIDLRFRSATAEGGKVFAYLPLLPQSLRVEGLRVLVPWQSQKQEQNPKPEPEAEQKPEQGFFTTILRTGSRGETRRRNAWHKLLRQVGFVSSLVATRSVELNDSTMILERQQQHLLRLRFNSIVADNRNSLHNGLTWRGRGLVDGAGATSRTAVVLNGSYANTTGKLYQSLDIEDLLPRELLRLLVAQKDDQKGDESGKGITTPISLDAQSWIAKTGRLSLDYRLDLHERQSLFRLRFVTETNRNTNSSASTTTPISISIASGRKGVSNTNVAFHALPLGVVWHASDVLLPPQLSRKALPFELSGVVQGRLSLQRREDTQPQFAGSISLQTPHFRWNESDEGFEAHRLEVAMEGDRSSLRITTSLDFDEAKESGLQKSITLLPHEAVVPQENSSGNAPQIRASGKSEDRPLLHPSRFRLRLQGNSRGSVPLQTVRALWPPRFKPLTRETTVAVAKGGEIEELDIALETAIDLTAKTRRVSRMEGSFLLRKGRLELFAKPATLTDVEADARFVKNDIRFKVKRARYDGAMGDFLINDGEVSFKQETLASLEEHTLMRVALFGEGAAEQMRRFVRVAPFLQSSESLQRSARWLPPAPRARAKGHFNMTAFLKQLSGEEADTVFPHPFSYDSAWQFDLVRLQAPFLRFYEGEGSLVSTSTVPLALVLRAKSDYGATIEGKWRIALGDARSLRQHQEEENLTLQGSLDAKALASDFPYLPQGWLQKEELQKNLPINLTYRKRGGGSTKGLLKVAFPHAQLRLESLQPVRSNTARLFGGVTPRSPETSAASWRLEGQVSAEGEKSLLLQRETKGGTQEQKPLSLLLERLSDAPQDVTQDAPQDATQDAARTTAQVSEWRMTLAGEKLDLSQWVAQKPWRSFIEEGQAEDTPPSLGWSDLTNLTFDARLDKLQLQPEDGPADMLEQVHANLRWQGGRVRDASFSTEGGVFARSEKKQRKVAKRRVRAQALYTRREGKEFISAQSDDFGSLLHQTAGKKFAEGGKARLSLVRDDDAKVRPKPHFQGYATVRNISLYDMPLLFKILDAVNLISAFTKGITKLDMRSDLQMWDGIVSLKDFSLANNLTAITANGSLDLRERKVDARGEIASLPIVSKILRSIPLIGHILVGGKRHNLFAFSYEAKGAWDDPRVTASPFNLFVPGILKLANPLQLLERDEIKKEQQREREEIAKKQEEEKAAVE